MRLFMRWLRAAFAAHHVSLFAYCLMPNHFHFIVAVGDFPIARAMHQLLTTYALYFNRRYGRVGHLFQGRYGSRNCEDLGHLIQAVAYTHLNPVRAGLCESPSDWRWSSHKEFASGHTDYTDLDRLAELTEMKPEELRLRYLERLEAEQRTPLARKLNAADMLLDIARQVGVTVEGIRGGKRGAHTEARRAFIRWASESGYNSAEIAALLNCHPSAVSLLRKDATQFGACPLT